MHTLEYETDKEAIQFLDILVNYIKKDVGMNVGWLHPCRFCELWQSGERTGCDPGDERIPDRNEATQSAAEETEGRQSAVLSDRRSWQQSTHRLALVCNIC